MGVWLIICKIPQHYLVRRPMAKTLVHILKNCCAYSPCFYFSRGEFGPGGGGGARWIADGEGSSQAPLQLPSMMCNGAMTVVFHLFASSSRVAAGLVLGMLLGHRDFS